MSRMPCSLTLLTAGLLACAACSRPPEKPAEDKPEPQATQLRAAIQQPIDKAKAVEGDVQKSADGQRADIEAAGG